jgi:NADPH:quinone reductase-like Zn-dependent oxidoreductase
MKFGGGGVAMCNFQTREIVAFLSPGKMDHFQAGRVHTFISTSIIYTHSLSFKFHSILQVLFTISTLIKMSFPYKTVLVLGATSGIGLALAEKLIENGSHVIAVGRRKENLDSFVSEHGKEKASSIQFDIIDLSSIPSFAES